MPALKDGEKAITKAIKKQKEINQINKIMSYDIIVRFPNKNIADEFCGQMSDGFGENFCDFRFSRQIEGTDGKKNEHYERITSAAPNTTPVYFVNGLFLI